MRDSEQNASQPPAEELANIEGGAGTDAGFIAAMEDLFGEYGVPESRQLARRIVGDGIPAVVADAIEKRKSPADMLPPGQACGRRANVGGEL